MVEVNLTYLLELLIFIATYLVCKYLLFGPFLKDALDRERRCEEIRRKARRLERDIESIKEDRELVFESFSSSMSRRAESSFIPSKEGVPDQIKLSTERVEIDRAAVAKMLMAKIRGEQR